jgi:hypothetical protein
LQCDYFFGRETDRQKFQCITVQMPGHYSDHHALVAVIYAGGGGGELKQYQQLAQQFPISLPPGPLLVLNSQKNPELFSSNSGIPPFLQGLLH